MSHTADMRPLDPNFMKQGEQQEPEAGRLASPAPDQAVATLSVQVARSVGNDGADSLASTLWWRLAGQRPAGRHRLRRHPPSQRQRQARACR